MSLPRQREGLKAGLGLSIAFHALIILLIVAAPLAARFADSPQARGAGGPGPAGGGGGGSGGTGGGRQLEETIPERLRYLQMRREREQPAPPLVPEAETPPTPEPEPEPEEPPAPATPDLDLASLLPESSRPSVMDGVGGGSGRDGSAGTGPGSGGGIGSGIGTGIGSAVGPGSGGGDGTIYPPTPVEVLIPPMPVPSQLRGMTIVAMFEVDTSGRVMSVDFESTRHRGYDRDLRERLRRYRFRPAVRTDGTPVRATVPIPIRL